ncbi:hypothetical protein C8E86_3200 [Catellatospora citrea]|nr:hypothetical protein C8E86_3200 [Catellatospora citrea]
MLDHLTVLAGNCLGAGDTPKDASPTGVICIGVAVIMFSLLWVLMGPDDERRPAVVIIGAGMGMCGLAGLILGIARAVTCG